MDAVHRGGGLRAPIAGAALRHLAEVPGSIRQARAAAHGGAVMVGRSWGKPRVRLTAGEPGAKRPYATKRGWRPLIAATG